MSQSFQNLNITVMGLGRFGGGAGVARWLAQQGAKVLITDLQSESDLQPSLTSLQRLIESGSIELHLGEHKKQDFTTPDLIIVNPAVPHPWDNQFLRAAQAAGVPLTTEIRLLVERLDRQQIIGITGTAGKSTTAAMIHHILQENGQQSHLGGNIGGSLLEGLDKFGPEDWVVLELSSAMLHWLGLPEDGESEGGGNSGDKSEGGWSPHIGVLTNLAPNHLDWHGTFEHYQQSKQNIFRFQKPEENDHQITLDLFDRRARPIPLTIPGQHNQENAHLAMAASLRAAGIAPPDAVRALSTFRGLPHRLELVAERDGMKFFNDSKSTTPQATVLAVASFPKPSKIHLIAGGYDKGLDLSPISTLAPKLARLYTIGATGQSLALAASPDHAQYCNTLEQAITAALAQMKTEDTLLLSPGCASWDQFDNYEQRGETFNALVTQGATT